MEPFQLPPASDSLSEDSGLECIDRPIRIAGFPGHPALPPGKPSVFMPAQLRDMRAFWEAGQVALQTLGIQAPPTPRSRSSSICACAGRLTCCSPSADGHKDF